MSILFHTEPSPPDSALISNFQSGDSGAFDLLYLRHRARIEGVIRSIVSNPDDALDITQEVFLKAYQKLSGFKRVSQFYSWLYRIAVNQCIDHMRRCAVAVMAILTVKFTRDRALAKLLTHTKVDMPWMTIL